MVSPLGLGFRLEPLLTSVRNKQKAALRSRVLERRPHQGVDQFLQNDLARDRLGDFDDGREVKVLNGGSDRARRRGR